MARHLSASGRFEFIRRPHEPIHMVHVASGKHAATFSHLSVRSIKAARAGTDAAEQACGAAAMAHVDRGDGSNDWRAAGRAFIAAMRNEFPNGGVSM